MPRRGENVYKRKDGRWEGRIIKPGGKIKYVYAATYKEVKEKKNDLQRDIMAKGTSTVSIGKTATELFEHWLSDEVLDRVKATTHENYSYCINNYVIPFFKNTGSNCITEQTVEKFVKSIRDNLQISESYKRKLLSIFKTALRDILKTHPNYSAIIQKVILPKMQNREVQAFSVNEQRLIENAVLNSKDKRAIGILLCFYTGIRLGELCALRWEDIDFEAGTMSVSKTVARTKNSQHEGSKTMLLVGSPKSQKSMRKIPLPGFLITMAKEMPLVSKEKGCYILTGTDKPLDPRTYEKLFKRILIKSGVKDRKFHTIRHTFATRALELGVDIKTMSEILGHSNVTVTLNIYAHSLYEQKRIAIDKLNSMHMDHMEITAFAVTVPVSILNQ
jgi:integrase